MTAIEELLRRNERSAPQHPEFETARPSMKVVVVTCMDARIEPHAAFGVEAGEVHLLRNAGGVVTDDVIRSIAISQHALGTEEIMVIQHTGCGMATLHDDEFRDRLAASAGYRPTWAVQAFRDPHDSVVESVRRITDSPFLLHRDRVRGFVFDVQSGLLDEVVAAEHQTPPAADADGAGH